MQTVFIRFIEKATERQLKNKEKTTNVSEEALTIMPNEFLRFSIMNVR